ncbi:MAG: SpoIIE family protein phosphatase [Caldithrix sp.]|nr:SpoIIE family protein phosphatase [Caldithrix sp.]
MFNSISDGVVVADANGEFVFFNQFAEDILGMGLQKVKPDQWSDIYGCFYMDQVTPFPADQLPLVQSIQTGKISRQTVFIRNHARPEGVFIDITGSPIMDNNHAILGGIVIFKDITDSKKSELAIKESAQRLMAQFNGIPIPTYVWRKAGDDFELIDYNKAADTFTEGDTRQLLGITFSKMYPDPSDAVYVDFRRCFDEQTSIQTRTSYVLKTSGKKKELKVRYVYVPPDLVVVHTEDITDIKHAEQQLEKLSNAVEQTADAVLLTDREGLIEYVNPAFEVMTGYGREEAIGKTPRILKSGQYDPAFYGNLWKNLLSGKPYRGEMINQRKSGEAFYAQNTITPIKDGHQQIVNFVSVIKDITDIKAQKEQEIRLQIAKEIQQRLYASNIHLPGYDIAGKNYPADETGGDYYEIILTPQGHLWLAIADVSSHGMGPALIMAGTRAYLRAFLQTESNPAEILTKLNNVLHADLDVYQYVTMLLVHLNTKNHEMIYAGAGHVPAYWLKSAGKVEHVLRSTGIPLGYKKNEQYENTRVADITAGDMLVLLTDGIMESQDADENEFGFQRILDLIQKHKDGTSEEIINQIYREVCSYTRTSNQQDDITVLVCKINDLHQMEQVPA